jgi:hypothetical protein
MIHPHVSMASDLHPHQCDGKGACIHCDRTKTNTQDPDKCALCCDGDYYVTVCAECQTSSCWLGMFMCQKSDYADTKQMKASELDKLHLENPGYYSRATLLKHCGSVDEVVQ